MAAKNLQLLQLEAREVPAALVGNQLVEVWGQRDTSPVPVAEQPPGPPLVTITQAHYGVSVIDATTGAERVVYKFPETNGVATDLYQSQTGYPNFSGVEQPPIAGATDGKTLYVVMRPVTNSRMYGETAAASLIAIDLATGARRTVAAQLPGKIVHGYSDFDADRSRLYLVDGQLLWGVVTNAATPDGQPNLVQNWYRINPTTGAATSIAANISPFGGAVVSPDGGLFIASSTGLTTTITRYNVTTGAGTTLATLADANAAVQLSPSNNLLVITRGAAADTIRLREYETKAGALMNDATVPFGDATFNWTINGTTYELKTVGNKDLSRPAGSSAAFAEYPNHPGSSDVIGTRGDSIFMSFTNGIAGTVIAERNLKTGVERVLLDSPIGFDDYGQTFAKYAAEGVFLLGNGTVVDLTTVRQGPFGTDSSFLHPETTVLLRVSEGRPDGVVLGTYHWADAGAVTTAITTTPAVPPTVPPLSPPPLVPPASVTTLAISKAAPQMGEPVTLTAHVGIAGGKPVGAVTFADNGVVIGTAAVDAAGNAKLDNVKLRIGARKITATFTPTDPAHESGSVSVPLALTVAKAFSLTSLTTNLVSTGSLSLVRESHVISPAGAAIGTVTFKSGSTTLGTAKVDGNGVARLTVAAGPHQVQATYSGSSTVAGSQSAIVTAGGSTTVPPVVLGTTVRVVASAATITPTQTLNLSAFASNKGSPVTSGQMKFYDGSKLLGTIDVGVDGHANLSTTLTAYGTHSIKAVFGGTAAAPAGTSSLATVEVVKNATTVSYVAPPVPTTIDKPQSVAVRVASPQGGAPIGMVTLSVNGVALGTFAVNGNGVAQVVFPHGYTVGLGHLKFDYGGSSTFAASLMEVTI